MSRRRSGIATPRVKAKARLSLVTTTSGASAAVDRDSITVRDVEGEIVLRYDAATRELRIVNERGNVVLHAAGNLRLSADGEIEIAAKSLQAKLDEAKWHVGVWELTSERVFEKATDAYHEVSGLLRTRAGRLRTLVRGAVQLFGKRTEIVSEEDTVIDGERVLLG